MDLRRPQVIDALHGDAATISTAANPRRSARTALDSCSEIDELLEELAGLAASDSPAEQVHEQLLVAAIREAGAFGGAIWRGRDRLVERLPVHDGGLNVSSSATIDRRTQVIDRVLVLGRSCAAPIEADAAQGRTRRLICVAAPYSIEQSVEGAVELLLPAIAQTAEQERAQHMAAAFAEVVGDFHRRGRLDQYRKRELQGRAALQFVERIHRAELQDAAVAIVNEGRWFIGCDRVSLLCGGSRGGKLLAVSGVDRIDPRACITRRIRELAAVVLWTNEPLWESGDPAIRAPQIEQPLQAYLEEAHARALVALPLQSRPVSAAAARDAAQPADNHANAIGVLVLEWFTMPALDALSRQAIELAARHAATALTVAQSMERLPLIRVNRALAKIGWLVQASQLPTTLWGMGIALSLVIALLIVPADFEIAAEGELQPAERREIYCPTDGVVDAVLVEHGDDVASGQTLLRLRSPALDFEKAHLEGETQTAQKRLAAIRAARFERSSDKDGASHRYRQLTAEEEELKQTLHSLHQQEQLLAAQRTELEIRAPLAGRVLTWDLARSLAARPVERGQSLLSVGDIAGRWQIELAVPDHQIGYVLAAKREQEDQPALRVSFLLIAESGVTYEGEVERIALRSRMDEHRAEPVVLVTVRFNEPIENPRPGAGVVGKIQCGRRSLGFVWLHDAWNSFRRRVLF
ncbi:MAG: HlyD family efflux transporter periplasmic adaptor subunit [Pirellulales bacterium]